MAGRQVRCPHCQGVFAVTATAPVPPSAPVPVRAATVPAPVPAPSSAARSCPACQAPLRRGALSCLECGYHIGEKAAPRPIEAPPLEVAPIKPSPVVVAPIPVSPVKDSPIEVIPAVVRPAAVRSAAPAPIPAARPSAPTPLDFRQWHPALRLLPAGLLGFVLLIFMVHDRFVSGETEEEDPETPLVELPIDPNPLLDVKFQHGGDEQSGPMRFGLTMLKEKDDKGKPKRLTFSDRGDTNNALTQIDGESFLFGKFIVRTGVSTRKGDQGGVPDLSRELPILRGSWREGRKPLGQDRTGRERIGQSSVYSYQPQHIEVTQTVEIAPGEQVAPGQTKRHLDTCLVRYRIENQDDKPHRVGFRFVLDTFIGGNDGVPFTIPGASGLCDTSRDFPTSSSVPDFIQALERPSLENPGTVAHLTLRLGGRLDPPDRVTLGRWINQLQWKPGEEPHVDWLFPVLPMRDNVGQGDSGVVLYWDAKELPPKGHREMGFAYGLGHVSSGEGGGKLGLTVGGSFLPGEEFTVTAYVNEPLPRQTVSLELPRGLTRVDGEATRNVPPLPADAVSRNSPVTWKVKAARRGRYTLRVKASNGVTQTQAVTITSNGIFD